MSTLESHYSASDIQARILDGLRRAGLEPEQGLSPEQIGALDHFHTGGLQASRELLDMAGISERDIVLDIGAGLAGSARFIASVSGCRVDCIELSADYCAGAELLNRLTGLEHLIAVRQGSALELPYGDDSYDVVWMQNVGMNIADKHAFYAEIARVLKPGGRFAFQEVAAGDTPLGHFPLPWATEPADNHLLNQEQMLAILDRYGLSVDVFEDVSDSTFSTSVANSTPSGHDELGLSIYVDNLAEKAGNARRGLEDGMVRYVRGVFRLG